LTPDQIAKAQKYCKWASSALNYDDIKTDYRKLKECLGIAPRLAVILLEDKLSGSQFSNAKINSKILV
ncbi:unnamed protein product, partial [Arctia plantaginis]